MTIRDVLNFLDSYCPFATAEEWDHVGLSVGREDATVHKVLLALDVTTASIEAARAMGAELLLTHHPLLMEPVDRVTDGRVETAHLLRLAESGIAHIACHTNLDKAQGGVNDCLAALCGLTQVEELDGLGRVGTANTTFSRLTEELTEALMTRHCVGTCGQQQVRRVAVVGGSGGSMLRQVQEAECDTLVTGEAKYHQILEAKEMGLNLLVLGHYETEYPVLAALADGLKAAFGELEVDVLPFDPPMECF